MDESHSSDAIQNHKPEIHVPDLNHNDRAIQVMVCTLFFLTAWNYIRTVQFDRDDTAVTSIRTTVSPNTAPWYELTAVPEIGPSLAMTIVDARTTNSKNKTDLNIDQTASNHTRAFKQPSDLDRVRGIGPATLRTIAPYMHFEE